MHCCCLRFKPSLDLMSGVSMGHLKEARAADFVTGFQSFFSGGAPDSAAAGANILLSMMTEDG
jgi:hypothetical protein